MPRRRQLVIFKVGVEEFAVDILLTKEVVVMREITPVPETKEYVEGVMNLRGNLVPVIDLRKRLRARARVSPEESRIIVANLEEKLAGLIVDGASETIKVSEDQMLPPPDMMSEIGADYVRGIINHGDRFITLIDLKSVLSEEINCELDEVIKALSLTTGQAPAQAV